MAREEHTFCRICTGHCGLRLSIEEDRIVDVRGDKDHPMTMGYVCIKALVAQAQYYGPQRILRPLKRDSGGRFKPIPLEQALDEISDKLRGIIAQSGSESVATYMGSGGYASASAQPALVGWMRAIGSPKMFSSLTIDQSAKFIANYRLGFWSAGVVPFAEADVWIFAGANPLVSVQGLTGFPALNPQKRLKQARARGMKLIVIDPRRTETARYADIHLQLKAGEDVAMAGGLLNIILCEGWEDRAFCAEHVQGLVALKEAVSVFTPDYVEQRTGVPSGQVREAARLFALQCRRGALTSGTGPSMGPNSNLAEHLYACINVICGRFVRSGERISNPGVLGAPRERRAQVIRRKTRPWERGPRSRTGHGTLQGEMMSGILAEEILRPGRGQVRCVISEGGNPVSALPDLEKSVRAFKSLELLVAIDPYLNNTSRLAHYILPSKLPFERHDLPMMSYETAIYPEPFVQYAKPVVPPPEGSELVDDWYFYWATAGRLGLTIDYDGVPLDMSAAPTTEHLLALLVRRGLISFEELRECNTGKIVELPPQYAKPADPATASRFDVLPDDVAGELYSALDDTSELENDAYPYRLAVRRMRDVFNSSGRDIPVIRKRHPYNPAYLNPADLDSLGLEDGDCIFIESEQGSMPAIVAADESMRIGVVSITHGWGGLAGGASGEEPGSNVNLLVSTNKYVEAVNAMPRFGGIPIRIVPA